MPSTLVQRAGGSPLGPVVSVEGPTASMDEAALEPAKKDSLTELTKDNFYEFLASAGDNLVVVDFYTDW